MESSSGPQRPHGSQRAATATRICSADLLEGIHLAIPDSRHRIYLKVEIDNCRSIPDCATRPQFPSQDNPPQVCKSPQGAYVAAEEQAISQLLSTRDVFWQEAMAGRLSPRDIDTRRVFPVDGLKLLNHVLDSTRVTMTEAMFLQFLAKERIHLFRDSPEPSPSTFLFDPSSSLESSAPTLRPNSADSKATFCL